MRHYEDYLLEKYKPILDGMNKDSQNYKILNYLLNPVGMCITPGRALGDFGCFRLAARISDLRKLGIEINMKMMKGSDGTRYARYWIGRSDLW